MFTDCGGFQHASSFRVRYSETDQLGTFYNSRVLEWFECGRTELLRAGGLPYKDIEARGAFLPLVEAHVQYLGRARYDDLLKVSARMTMSGKARLRFEMNIEQAESGQRVAQGYTVHAITDATGKPIRPPPWLTDRLSCLLGSPSAGRGDGTRTEG